MNKFVNVFSALTATFVGVASLAPGSVIINVQEVGNDVVMSGSGTLDLTAWMLLNTPSQGPGVQPSTAIELGTVPHFFDLYSKPVNFTGPTMIGPGVDFVFADSGSGDALGMFWAGPQPAISVPAGYVSGAPITGSSATYVGESFASLGLTEGSYTWTWNTASGGSDSFTINIGAQPTIGDLTGDGVVNGSDLLELLNAWGPCAVQPASCPADLDASGAVSGADLLILLVNWG